MEKPRVFITRRLVLAPQNVLGAGIQIDVHDSEEAVQRSELLRRVREASALLAVGGDRVDKELLEAAPRLRIVANHAVGYDNVDVPACTARGVWVTNTPDVLTDATADLTWALILALARRVREGERMVRAGEFRGWAPTMLLGRDLRERTLGILGYGRIGRAVARRAEGFGMRVLFNARGGGVPFDELLPQADILSIHCPLTPQTRHLIGPAELLRMKRGSLLVNTARGPIVDEAALVAALESGHLGGAALDVFENEPAVHPGLLGRDDVVLLPHLGSATQQTRESMARIALEQVERVLRGERPTTAVNEVTPP
ncbi:MAG: D-glycerate dehydrogenase [Deltaproteobacteria bacterium]|nr:MAG: D-glycerate dehydrogenase [Deltaproteobacteria bacterium 13_1_40CM_4_68_19]OLD45517.1 MAG: D-glycerate dehydrogenase [Chloroflexi bacterium 13_1_40CM_2_68_14]TMB14464.1 MAG: D-glycerate dehydrogenase [Deltaproteobacteria bacterium]HMC34317.1 D-glycerate dehydrogenase [Myxococcales bacterium]